MDAAKEMSFQWPKYNNINDQYVKFDEPKIIYEFFWCNYDQVI